MKAEGYSSLVDVCSFMLKYYLMLKKLCYIDTNKKRKIVELFCYIDT